MKNQKTLIVGLVLLALLFSASVTVLAKKYEISRYDIRLNLEESGDYIITEKITYNFQEGSFSWASRNVKGQGFDKLELVSVEGINTGITDYEVKQGDNLKVKWSFPETTGKLSFLIKYRASGGLITENRRNKIDWLAVGKDWTVPIHNLNVWVTLPQSVNNINVSPARGMVNRSENEIYFSKEKLTPGEAYRITVTFPLLIKTNNNTPSNNDRPNKVMFSLIAGFLIGLVVVILDILNKTKVKKVKTSLKYNHLTLPEQAVIYADGRQNKAGIAARIITLAQNGKIKLISQVKKGAFGTKNTRIEVKILKDDNLSEVDKIIIDKLKEHQYLKQFAMDYKVFSRVHEKVKTKLKDAGLVSKKALQKRRNIYFSSLYLLPAGIGAIVYGGINDLILITGLGVFLCTFGIGRLIKGAITPILSGPGISVKLELEEHLNETKDRLDNLVEDKKAGEALNYFFKELPAIIMHKKFTSSSLNNYKKVFKNAKEIEIPQWIEFDLDHLDKTIDALDIIEVIDYLIMSIIVITSSTGATTTGGSGGGAAGGGGGAAG